MSGKSQTNWWEGLNAKLEQNVPLSGLTWFGLGGPARYLVSPSSRAELSHVVRRAREHDITVKVLGGGANVLVRDDGFDGLVIRLDDPDFAALDFADDHVTAGAGVDLMQLAFSCARKGLSGLEALAGIPGTVGGAVRMNAGGRHGDIGDVVENIDTVDHAGQSGTLDHDRVGFTYRHTDLNGNIVCSATLKVAPDDPEAVLDRFREFWAEKKRTQPLAARSAGCVFKNPPGKSAGALVDQAGLKGTTIGGATVSETHANFFVTTTGARAAEVIALIALVRRRVKDEHGIDLETEIDIW